MIFYFQLFLFLELERCTLGRQPYSQLTDSTDSFYSGSVVVVGFFFFKLLTFKQTSLY